MPTALATPSDVEAAQHRTPSSTPVGRLAYSDPGHPGGFVPGAVLADRYRIIGLIGRGGMGEVYRADDLKLGQPVALKFLSQRFASDRLLIERFYAEVRHARQVSHPNVCRVYDVGEIDGRHFLSMEYIDGEDLASLLRRIGRLGGERAIEIAREIVAGLAAAHDKGVLHRDLKPGNVMIDGRGRARITDFGLAVAAGEDRDGLEVSGTPAYMAPEQLAGKGSSVQSDLYALGLVLYELFTGRKAFEAATLAEWRHKHSQEPPTAPSTVTPGLDAAVERAILRCLEKEPGKRPRSAAAVAAALPGGDPLAAAIAAGETPSPEMVAAAGGVEGMKPALAWACLLFVLLGATLAAYLSPKTSINGMVPLEKSPEVLAERSREILRRLGYAGKPVGTAFGFERDIDYVRYVEEHDRSPARWKDMADGRPAGLTFWYRQSPAYLAPENFLGGASPVAVVGENDPPPLRSGMVGIRLDTLGRLIFLEAVPPQVEEPLPSAPPPDWNLLFSEAGLEAGKFTAVTPKWLPASYADSRMAWVESQPERPERPLRVEAAGYRGKPVSFELLGPWSRPARMQEFKQTTAKRVNDLLGIGIFLAVLVGGGLIARRNLRLGRGDRRGALRVAGFVLTAILVSWALQGTHVATLSELRLFVGTMSLALFLASLAWVIYIALEPFVRRRWPDTLISWTRFLAGRLRDPLVGRDLLVGALVGVSLALATKLEYLIRSWVEATPPPPVLAWSATLMGPRYVAAEFLLALAPSMLFATAMALLFFLLRALVKKEWLAAAVLILVVATPRGLEGGWIAAIFAAAGAGALLWVLTRFGLLALMSIGFFEHFLESMLTTDFSAWYAGNSLFILVLLAAMAAYAFRIALAGQPMFSGTRLDE
jgi:predicted Ser/Thr protein kinase